MSAIIEARRAKIERGMTTSPEPTAVRFDDYSFWVDLDDGRTLGIPLA